jgi:hypothetical protein
MAYPTLSGPYGLKPINEVGGLPYAGSTRMIPIQQGYTTNMFNGDVVQVGAAGNLIVSSLAVPTTSQTTQTAVPATVGVLVGCEYSGPTGNVILGKNRYNAWLGATNGAANISDAVAYVVDDPNTVFKSAVLAQPAGAANTATAITTIGYMSPAFVGTNVYYVSANGGNTTNGNSYAGVSGNTAGASNGAGNVRITGGTGQTTGTPFRVVGLVQETAVVVSTTGTSSGTTLTVASSSGVYPGMQVIVPGATAGSGAAGYNTYVTAVTSATSITISSSVTAATSGVITFVGYPEVLVKWNYGFHGYTTGVSVA